MPRLLSRIFPGAVNCGNTGRIDFGSNAAYKVNAFVLAGWCKLRQTPTYQTPGAYPRVMTMGVTANDRLDFYCPYSDRGGFVVEAFGKVETNAAALPCNWIAAGQAQGAGHVARPIATMGHGEHQCHAAHPEFRSRHTNVLQLCATR